MERLSMKLGFSMSCSLGCQKCHNWIHILTLAVRLATIWVLLSKPAPPPAAFVGKSANYIRGYTWAYQRKTRSKNVIFTLIGWAISSAVTAVILLAADI